MARVQLGGRGLAPGQLDGLLHALGGDLELAALRQDLRRQPAGLAEVLVAALDGSEPLDPERPVHLHRRFYDPQTIGEIAVDGEQFGVREGKWKYIEAEAEGRRELYDLEVDPVETSNVHDEQPEIAAQLSERIAGWKLAYGREDDGQELSAEDIERLKALGYIN